MGKCIISITHWAQLCEHGLLDRTEVRMLTWIRVEEIRARRCDGNISENIREVRLRWLGLVVERKTE